MKTNSELWFRNRPYNDIRSNKQVYMKKIPYLLIISLVLLQKNVDLRVLLALVQHADGHTAQVHEVGTEPGHPLQLIHRLKNTSENVSRATASPVRSDQQV